ncbi:fimbria/pilus outer membrane usher protein [Aeromonas piscicola]|uniref:fimbria/pilus outer membrane usher protein n=1 Tax=Aeromonas piscicola TaxID=600645 RepID=UPI0021F8435E|nr:fimbria/pilus outer membrane usher protein [Aeromonas piscicola]
MKLTFLVNLYLSLVLMSSASSSYATEFNTDLLDVIDKENINLEQFRTAGYIVPGQYKMHVLINNHNVGEFEVNYVSADDGSSYVCFSAEQVKAIGFKDEYLQLALTNKINSDCYDLLKLPGVTAQGSLSTYSLTIGVPQTYMDYVADGWDPPSRWDEGINGILLDYGLNVQESNSSETNENHTNISAYGVAGVNISTLRIRADWQGQYSQSNNEQKNSEFNINRIYGYRALPEMTAQLKMGEIDMGSSVFDSFQFFGASLTSDESMLPPNLRGYAPEVVGIAKTNAKVVISQQGRVLYETQVAAGPFRIQDLNSYVAGTLDVRVEEQDGALQTFQVSSAPIPYLSRPGSVRYKLATGLANLSQRDHDGLAFASGEFSWGINNGWSLFGGGLFSDGYSSVMAGVGQDLLDFGAISVDMTESWASLPEGKSKSGASYRVNYSKNFEKYRSQLSFAGYRFSDRDFLNMNDYIAASKENSGYRTEQKALYTVALSKQFEGSAIGAHLNYNNQKYWNEADRKRISLSLSSYFDFMDWKGMTSSITAYSSKQYSTTDNGLYFSLSIPWGLAKSVGYSVSADKSNTINNIHINNRVDERNSYSMTAGSSSNGSESISGFYFHSGDIADMNVNVSHQSDSSSGIGLSLNGGMTATAKGAALHRASMAGGSRIMIDTESVADVPVSGYGPTTKTNRFGKAVVADVSSYDRSQTNIDVNNIDDDIEVIGSPVRNMTLTEGAIGYEKFDMLSGSKRMVQIKRVNGKYVPMAAVVYNSKQQPVGMVAEDGLVYLAGLREGESLQVNWSSERCNLMLPIPLPPANLTATLECH